MSQSKGRYVQIIPTRANKLAYHFRTMQIMFDDNQHILARYPEECIEHMKNSNLNEEVHSRNISSIHGILSETNLLSYHEKNRYFTGYKNLARFMNLSTTLKTKEELYKPIQYLLHRTYVCIDNINNVFTNLYDQYLKSFDSNQGLNRFDNKEASIIVVNAENYSIELNLYRNLIRVTLIEPFKDESSSEMNKYYKIVNGIYRELESIRCTLDLNLIETDDAYELLDFKYLFIRYQDYYEDVDEYEYEEYDPLDLHDFLLNEYHSLYQIMDHDRFLEASKENTLVLDKGTLYKDVDDWWIDSDLSKTGSINSTIMNDEHKD